MNEYEVRFMQDVEIKFEPNQPNKDNHVELSRTETLDFVPHERMYIAFTEGDEFHEIATVYYDMTAHRFECWLKTYQRSLETSERRKSPKEVKEAVAREWEEDGWKQF